MNKIQILDGGLGTLIQSYNLTEEDFGGKQGCNDYLCLTRADVIEEIHRAYVSAGADIISTNSFNATAVSMREYGLEDKVYQINLAAAQIARRATEGTAVKVAGSVGPTSKSLSMSPDVERPGYRAITFEALSEDYALQMRGLIDGGVDIILIETVFDTLNAKAAIFALRSLLNLPEFPLMISGTITDLSGRTLSGQTLEAFYESVRHGRPISIGLNCAFGARQLKPYVARLAEIADCGVSAHPNAGLPNVMGGYDESAEQMALVIEEYMADGIVNIIGGCCGTTPEHIRRIAQIRDKYAAREVTPRKAVTTLTGLEPLYITPELNFVNVGERTNVAGSAKFARLIRERKFDEALSVALDQVEGGASIIDVCMDAALIDGAESMSTFLNLMAAEPDISRIPVMIDSSSWEVLEAGLRTQQGKSVVNSISLKEGEQEFLRRAALVANYGAAAVVMLFDERGQADSFERKIEVADRVYKLWIDAGFQPENIIFDPNVLAIATGMSEHDDYGVAFIKACSWIKANCPGAKISGGVSNLSFSFRGNNTVREAMHSVFLYHAIAAGMDMGIVNPSMLQIYDEIEPNLRQLVEDVVMNRYEGASEKLIDYATLNNSKGEQQITVAQAESLPLEERIVAALVKGQTATIEADTEEAYQKYGSALDVIDQILMVGMGRVGELFASGKMFLPQVVKSARVMKQAVAILNPYILATASTEKSNKRLLFATVKGDVHDIGKNICSIVLQCNGYEVEDLGVMTPTENIVRRAIESQPDVVLLSGLITPSLDEMRIVAAAFEQAGLTIPISVGGATTSALHTAVKIAPSYSGLLTHSSDASSCVSTVNSILNDAEFPAQYLEKQVALRKKYEEQTVVLVPLAEAREKAQKFTTVDNSSRPLGREVLRHVKLDDLVDKIDWNYFFAEWSISGRFPAIFDHPTRGVEARKLYDDAQDMIKHLLSNDLIDMNVVRANVRARRRGDDIVVGDCDCCSRVMPQLRNQTTHFKCVSDFVSDKEDVVMMFALGASLTTKFDDDYQELMARILCDRFVAVLSDEVSLGGLQLGFGYPATPDHNPKRIVFDILDVPKDIVYLSDNYSMHPTASACGLVIYNPEAQWFSVGMIGQDQIDDYTRRTGITEAELRRNIPHNVR